MMNLAEYRNRSARLADFLPWAALVADGVVLNKDGSFQRTARFRGPDLDSSVPAELVAVAGRLNNAFRRLGSGWSIFVEAQRHAAAGYPASTFPDAASALVDAERKAGFEEAGRHYESSYFLTVLFLPHAEDAARTEGWLYENRPGREDRPREIVAAFLDRTDRLLQLVEGFMPSCRWLTSAETLTFLHACVSTKRHRVRVPETPMYLDALLADQPLTGGLEPMLGDQHLRVLTLTGFPTVTTPGLLDELNRLAFPYRWSTRAILLDKVEAVKVLTKIRRQWFAKRKSVAAILKEVMTNEASALVDSDADNKAADADLALQELGADYAGMAYVTATVTVWDADSRIADEKLRLVEKIVQGRDFTAMPETINAVDAWLDSLPGHVYANVRQPPISTLNLAHMIPISAVWTGPERDEHFGAPPLFFGQTKGSTPFRFSLHVGDVGHTLVVGPTGAGKSVLLALKFRRYAGAQVFAFDFGGSIRAAALATGGDWHDLGGSGTTSDARDASQMWDAIDRAQARNVAYEVGEIDRVFEQQYGNVSMTASDRQLVAQARSRFQTTVGGLQDAMRVQAGVVGNIETNRATMGTLVGASQGATGALQATQAGNQLLALQAQQLADLTATVAANGRADALAKAEEAATVAEGREHYRRFSTRSRYQPGTVTMFGR